MELDPSLIEAGDGDDAGGKYSARSIVFDLPFVTYFGICNPDDQIREDEEGEGIMLGGATATRYPWEGTDRDYKYEEVLTTPYLNLLSNL